MYSARFILASMTAPKNILKKFMIVCMIIPYTNTKFFDISVTTYISIYKESHLFMLQAHNFSGINYLFSW
jgi:hypothetical protein